MAPLQQQQKLQQKQAASPPQKRRKKAAVSTKNKTVLAAEQQQQQHQHAAAEAMLRQRQRELLQLQLQLPTGGQQQMLRYHQDAAAAFLRDASPSTMMALSSLHSPSNAASAIQLPANVILGSGNPPGNANHHLSSENAAAAAAAAAAISADAYNKALTVMVSYLSQNNNSNNINGIMGLVGSHSNSQGSAGIGAMMTEGGVVVPVASASSKTDADAATTLTTVSTSSSSSTIDSSSAAAQQHQPATAAGKGGEGKKQNKKCVPLEPPIPSYFQGDMRMWADAPVPEFPYLVNYPSEKAVTLRNPPNHADGVLRTCVMCGRSCPYGQRNESGKKRSSSSANGTGAGGCGKKKQASAFVRAEEEAADAAEGRVIIPTQNKGLCTSCDKTVWKVRSTGLQIKWCKGCKNFRPWAAFGVEGFKSKCLECRNQQKERYAQKQKSKGLKVRKYESRAVKKS